MDLVLLAAGFATRLEPLTLNQPKHLLPIKDGGFIDLLINQLKKVEDRFDRKILITNDRYAKSFAAWQKESPFKVDLINDGVKTKDERLGATGDLLCAIEKAKLDSDLLVLASDFIYRKFDFRKFLDFIVKKDSSVTVLRHEEDSDQLKSGSCLSMDKSGRITKFEEKPTNPFSNLYGVPYYFIKKEDLELIKAIPRELWDNCGQIAAELVKKSSIYGFRNDGEYFHMTTLSDYNRIKKL